MSRPTRRSTRRPTCRLTRRPAGDPSLRLTRRPAGDPSFRLTRRLAVPAATLAALLASAAPAVPAAPTVPAAVPPGHVYFWAERGQMGPGGAWDYAPPGYREAEPRVKRHAYSFDSHAPVSVYAIHFRAGGGCLYREIRPDDYDDDWSDWATKFDGVSDTKMGCEAG